MTMETIQVQMKRQPGTEDVPLPEYMSEHASGMDVRAAVTEPVTLAPGQVGLIPTGFHIAIPPGYEVQVRPRSGLALKRGLTVLNAPGTIDSDYRGEVQVILVNLSAEAQRVEPGDRVAQLVFAPVTRALMVAVIALADSDRGAGGFGSTGVR